jgi:hypothetical protein
MAGYRIPRCGEFSEMTRLGVPLVAYTDERAHCGLGKELWRPGDTVCWRPSTFCSEFIGDPDARPARSRRRLIVGHYEIHLDYASEASWMSNVDGDFRVYAGPITWPGLRNTDLLRYPMYAVDQVWDDSEDERVAVDLNVNPYVPLEVVNAVGRDTLTKSVHDFCASRGFLK